MEDKSLNYIFHETLDKLLHLSHNPVQCVEYLTQQIHELVGAKSVIIAVHKETNSSEIFGLYPPLQKEWANQQAITELIDISFQNTKIQFWDKASQHILVVNNLKYLEIEKAICIPLVFAEKIIGSILMLGAKDVNNRDNIIKVIGIGV
jgi:hypothetical protein